MVDFNPGSLSRLVPERLKTIKFNWCKRDFMKFGFYRGVREKRRMEVQSSCFWCRTAFKDDEMMALAQPEKGANKLLCQSCAEQISSSDNGPARHE